MHKFHCRNTRNMKKCNMTPPKFSSPTVLETKDNEEEETQGAQNHDYKNDQ
jgi:hypothetical protein